MELTIGFSPCPNDTFMFAALINKWIDTRGITFKPYIADIEQLNVWAGNSELDVTKVSFHRAMGLADNYTLLNSGAALGRGCGPLLISRSQMDRTTVLSGPVALPGKWTTAHLLFEKFYPSCARKQFHVFSEIEDLVLKGDVTAGVIIHENRFTYASKGLVKLQDLGEAWEKETGLPIPLGGIFCKNQLPEEVRNVVDHLIRESILYAHNNKEAVMPYVREFAQEMDEEVMLSHIGLYVNDYSIDLGPEGLDSVRAFKKVFQKRSL